MDQTTEVNLIRSLVAARFEVYDVKVSYEAVEIMVTPDKAGLENAFEELRKDLYAKGYIPVLDYRGGEYSITVVRKPPVSRRRTWINIIFLTATAVTTIYTGALLYASYIGSTDILAPENVLLGAALFALPLMLILGTHELSHYYMSKRHGVDASLPYFLPAWPPIGTFGAFISMHDPMPSKKALVDIGIAGPLGGLLVSIPVAIIGLTLNAGATPQPDLAPAGQLAISTPFIFDFFVSLVPIPPDVMLHPTAFAAWVGIFVTAINLLPAGQLDGGHIARGLLGKNARYLSLATVMALFALGVFFYLGWLLFAFLILLLGLNHPAPLNDVTKIDGKRMVAGAVSVMLLVGSFVFVPLYQIPSLETFEMRVEGSNETMVAAGGTAIFVVEVNNTGTMNVTIHLDIQSVPAGWSAILYETGSPSAGATNSLRLTVPYGEQARVTMEVQVAADEDPGIKVLALNGATSDQSASAHTVAVQQFTFQVS